MRGFAMFALAVNHLLVSQSWFYNITGNGVFIVSAAELFYAVSGIVVGAISARQPLPVAIKRTLRRALELYLLTLSVALFFLALAWLTNFRLWDQAWRDLQNSFSTFYLWQTVISLVTLHNSFNGSDILVQYVIYLLITPLALWACAEDKDGLVVLTSLAVYVMGWWNPGAVTMPIASAFSLSQWQPLFFIGLVIGYRHAQIARWVASMQWRYLVAILIGAVALFFMYVYATDYQLFPFLQDRLNDRYYMPPVRLIFAAWYLLASYLLITLMWKPLKAAFGWLLLPFGRDALWCFSIHFIVIVLIYNLPIFRSDVNIWVGTAWHALSVALVFLSLYVRDAVLRKAPALRDRYKAASLVFPALASVVIMQLSVWLGMGTTRVNVRDDRDTGWLWQGWRQVQAAQAFGGSMRETQARDATAQYAFTGTNVELYGLMGRAAGKIEVVLNQNSYGVHDLYYAGADTFRVRIFSARDFSSSTHVLQVISRTNGRVALDYLTTR